LKIEVKCVLPRSGGEGVYGKINTQRNIKNDNKKENYMKPIED
jgi:hypothetical protein